MRQLKVKLFISYMQKLSCCIHLYTLPLFFSTCTRLCLCLCIAHIIRSSNYLSKQTVGDLLIFTFCDVYLPLIRKFYSTAYIAAVVPWWSHKPQNSFLEEYFYCYNNNIICTHNNFWKIRFKKWWENNFEDTLE